MPDIDLSKEEKKAFVKEALQEWLDAKFAAFGKWSFAGMMAMAIAGGAYFCFIKLGITLGVGK